MCYSDCILFTLWRFGLRSARSASLLPLLLLACVAASACSKSAARIEVSPKKVKIYGLDHPQRLTARILDKKGDPLEIGTANWESSRPAVAAVDIGGLVTPKGEGKATITARYEKVSTDVPVEVIDVKAVEVSPPAVHVVGPAGTSIPLQVVVRNSKDKQVAITPVWTSSAPAIATVSSAGVVSSAGNGVALIVAKIGDLQAASEATVQVREIARLEIKPMTALVRVGDSQQFQVIAYGTDGNSIEGASAVFQSTNGSVATVNATGNAAGISVGASTIRAVLAGATAEATLIVN